MVFLGNPEYEVRLHPIDFAEFAHAAKESVYCGRPERLWTGMKSF